MAIQPEVEMRVWESYRAEQPPIDEVRPWAERIGAEVGLSGDRVLRIIREQSVAYVQTLENGVRTVAQQAADTVGLTLTESLATLRDCMRATKRKAVLDRRGSVVIDPLTKKPMVLETPDYATRLGAVNYAAKIFGAYAPEKIEVETKSFNVNLNRTELFAQIEEAEQELVRFKQTLAARATPVSLNPGEARPDEGGSGAPGRLLLADGVHEDGGRAGPGEPVQAVPETAVHKAAPRRTRKTAGS